MATYYVQITSAWQGDRWHTCYKTDDPGLAEHLAGGLQISENQFGERNPGLSGMRRARSISKTQLQRQDGVPAVRIAQDDIDACWWDDAPTNPKTGRVRDHHEPGAVLRDLEQAIKAWEAEQAEKAEAGMVDFLVRDIPGDLHAKIKAHAVEHAVPMNQLIIEILAKAFQK